MNIIADVGGNGVTFAALVLKMPIQTTIQLGDLNDRGPHSKQAIQFAMDNELKENDSNSGSIITLDSNHGSLFTDFFNGMVYPEYKKRYAPFVFARNGGIATLNSYMMNEKGVIEKPYHDMLKDNNFTIPNDERFALMKKHTEWLATLPTHIQANIKGQEYFFTHAPISPNKHRSLDKFLTDDNSDDTYLWNRYEPKGFHKELPSTINIFGHNSGATPKIITAKYPNGIYLKNDADEATKQLQNFYEKEKGKVYAIAMDTTIGTHMWGLDLVNLKFYTQSYIEHKLSETKDD